MLLIMLFLVMNPHQRCLQAKVKNRNEPKQVMQKSRGRSTCRTLKVNLIWTFDTEFPIIINKTFTYKYFKAAILLFIPSLVLVVQKDAVDGRDRTTSRQERIDR